jgi:hypothetical protein
VAVQTGISDGLVTEITGGELREGESVIVGIEASKSSRSENLPPGFGGGGPHSRPRGRDRGL